MADSQTSIQRWSDDQTAVGTVLKSASPVVAEALGYTPIDFLFVDRQHGAPISDELESVLRAADLNGIPIMLRVPTDDLSMVTWSLDLGAKAIMLPQIESPTHVEEALKHVHYRKGRSLSTSSRAADFGYQDREEYIDFVDEELTLLPQIESVTGVECLEEILTFDEITDIAIGPGDLAFTMGVSYGSDEHRAMIERIFEIAHGHDCRVGTFVGSKSDLDRYAERASFVVYSSDIDILTSNVERLLE